MSHGDTFSAQHEEPANGGRKTFRLAFILMLYFSLNGCCLSLMPVVGDELHGSLGLSASQIGLLTSVMMFMLGATAIPAGLAGARWGGRVLIATCGFFVAGSLLFALSKSFGWLLAARALQGIAGGVTVPACTAVLSSCVTPACRTKAWGVFGTGHGAGVMFALLVMPSVAQWGGYRGVFLVTTGIAAVFSAAIALLRPVRALPLHAVGHTGLRQIGRSLRETAANRRVLILSLFNAVLLGTSIGAITWTPQYLEANFGAGLAAAAFLTAGLGVAQLIANPIGALAMARWGKLPVIGFSLASLT
ncbi:MAG: MFS transporter, partial [Thermoleophilia bacterium]|nr:MFS transporter [Thermoleophilia bacterium]